MSASRHQWTNRSRLKILECPLLGGKADIMRTCRISEAPASIIAGLGQHPDEVHMKTCPDCNGDGVVDKGTDDEHQCPMCGGSGVVPDDDDDEQVIRTT